MPLAYSVSRCYTGDFPDSACWGKGRKYLCFRKCRWEIWICSYVSEATSPWPLTVCVSPYTQYVQVWYTFTWLCSGYHWKLDTAFMLTHHSIGLHAKNHALCVRASLRDFPGMIVSIYDSYLIFEYWTRVVAMLTGTSLHNLQDNLLEWVFILSLLLYERENQKA